MTEVGRLVVRARGGDRSAWDRLVDSFWKFSVAVVASEGTREADREDVVQLAWLRVAQKLDQLDEPDVFSAWLRMICIRESRRFHRKYSRELPTESEVFDQIPDPTEMAEEVTRRIPDPKLRAAFEKLSARCQLLLRLIMFEVPYREIAAALEMPIGAIGPNRGRCLDKLRQLL